MVTTRIRCQVLEIPTQEDWSSRRGRPRDLLPWADPYIAGLVRKLEERFDAPAEWEGVGSRGAGVGGRGSGVGGRAAESQVAHGVSDLPLDDPFDDGWQEDAFMPRPLEEPRFHCYPPVVGGFPLLEE
jgi:hypothetical protein